MSFQGDADDDLSVEEWWTWFGARGWDCTDNAVPVEPGRTVWLAAASREGRCVQAVGATRAEAWRAAAVQAQGHVRLGAAGRA